MLSDGTDPSVQKKLEKISAATSAANALEALAEEWIDKQIREGRSEKTMARNQRLAKVANRELGKRPIGAITPPEVLVVLRRFEAQGKHETARRMKVFISSIATGCAESDRRHASRQWHRQNSAFVGFDGLYALALVGRCTAHLLECSSAVLRPALFVGYILTYPWFPTLATSALG